MEQGRDSGDFWSEGATKKREMKRMLDRYMDENGVFKIDSPDAEEVTQITAKEEDKLRGLNVDNFDQSVDERAKLEITKKELVGPYLGIDQLILSSEKASHEITDNIRQLYRDISEEYDSRKKNKH